ncbi:MAG: hypothetical protein NC489_30445 [Ruminococcus flavefaciens]|nr:hypothetical protein [Ruminococcus flavefaciens]
MSDEKKEGLYLALKKIVVAATIILAIIFSIYCFFAKSIPPYEEMILILLIFISTNFLLEHFGESIKWEKIEHKLISEIERISECQIECYENSSEWVERLNMLIRNGKHTVDTAALDSSTRSKMKHDKLWNLFLDVSQNPNIKFRHLVRIRKNLFENLLDRILHGNAGKDSYYAYYDLPSEFPFAAFEIIDDTFIAIRSPYLGGETPKYLIIKNKYISRLFIDWYDNLWKSSHTGAEILISLYDNRFKSEFNDKTRIRIEEKLKDIKEKGIMEDI